ncbi:bifunctional UDP-N-acetylmuramoyl-tripeptide:D-alanyl-D-alanine ligase/alanine racemase [Olivibacter sp. SDN3]|uniref:bifunctional UDP-N-acetylmuramoyl-tripeptide:D-alanyl-D-alanine ligase/alanine racemase n=1 Tax=Olivibacter sp. SDN3 TaxID=2764720 RepID=UPI00165101D4|nr:bifunctional UDP-N-acetylmuramoyl-tripeptide:D-alanyl-D-alanine ligase/alanine racemase [Olivibacter sp. SDN3]QNL49908.1 bifunctional UDP-N-acetylmuramoyl-tripeptide:D-alanyl-D-alanine ligase/alanine racemase [Olivibacter sp. SDN3]
MGNIAYHVKELADIIQAAYVELNDPNCRIDTLCYDSRKVTNPESSLFFALSDHRDGHQFIKEAFQLGIRNFVIHKQTLGTFRQYNKANFFAVDDTLRALQQLAAYHRKQFDYPVIAITGSNGKTIVKEWLNQLLAADFNIVRSPKSYNSQLGVPLSLWQMSHEHNLAIIEAGISKKNEMEKLAKMINPTIGIFTNLGHAHDDGFSSQETKAIEKLRLFHDVELLVYAPKYLRPFNHKTPGKVHFTWGVEETTDLRILRQQQRENHTLLEAKFKGIEVALSVPFTDQAAIENVICCWATLLALGYSTATIAKRIAKLHPIKMRLELKKGISNSSIIDDSYSNDISSLRIALDFLKQQNQHHRRILILSDIPAAINNKGLVYQQAADLIQQYKIDQLIAIGEDILKVRHFFRQDTVFFNEVKDLLSNIKSFDFSNSAVLIKGARTFGFERISRILTLQSHETVLEINLNALEHNLNYYKRLLDRNTKLMVMVKAFSYGSGSFEIANLLQFNKVDYLAVAYVDEGITLRNAGINLPIMVMSPEIGSLEQLVTHHLEPEIYSFDELEAYIKQLDILNQKHYPVHIKLDTGMHRLGFEEDDLLRLITLITNTDTIKIKSVFSHLVGSGNSQHDNFTKEQIDKFRLFNSQLLNALGYDFIKHIANTSAISRFPEAQFDMVRLGIGLYGIQTDDGLHQPLQAAAQLKTSITQIKTVKKGDTVSYNRSGKLTRDSKIATVKIGYADGYNRKLGNGIGRMCVNGQTVSTVGDICMDMCMLDVTAVTAHVGDEVIVMGEQITAEELAAKTGTIPYEILTSISQRVKRVYYYE